MYQAIWARRSVRRYDEGPLEPATLARIEAAIGGVRPLVAENAFAVEMRQQDASSDLVGILGAYGRLVSPPHLLVPHGHGARHVLVDLGYRSEQMVLQLTAMGLATCYVGALTHQDAARQAFGLAQEAQVGAAIAFGREAEGWGGRAINTLVRAAAGARGKLDVSEICFGADYEPVAGLPDDVRGLVDAARLAPSAVNAQPWRFVWEGGTLHLFVTRRNRRYGGGAAQAYRYFDGGICMAHVTVARRALGMEGGWTLYGPDEAGAPAHPEGLEPLAWIRPR
jgi:nitroreductase